MMNKNIFLHYRIEKELGRGGMGVVYKAQDLNLQRSVALKIIQTSETIPEKQAGRFIQEIKAITQLNHPNIINLFEANISPIPYYTMEYLKGSTLADWAKKSKNYHNLTSIIIQVAQGLSCAHSQHIIHRDIKPDNIMIDGNSVKIMDFGLAKNLISENSLSKTGTILGTPRYLSPEQIQGEQVDHRTDIYSLGVTLYECLTGRPIFEVSSYVSLLYQIVNYKVALPRNFDSNIPEPLESICTKCIAKNPNERYQSTDDLIQDLSNFLANKAISIVPNSFFHDMVLSLKKYAFRIVLLIANSILIFSCIFLLRTQNNVSIDTDNLQKINIDLTLFSLSKNFIIENTNISDDLLTYYGFLELKKEQANKEKDGKNFLIKKGMLFYQLRQKNTSYVHNAFDCWLSLKRDMDMALLLAKYYMYEENYEEAKNICTNALRMFPKAPKTLTAIQYSGVCLYAKNKNAPFDSTDGNVLLLRAKQESEIYNKEYLLRKSIIQEPDVEKFYLTLMQLYWKIQFYEGIEILYPTLKKLNFYLVEADFYMASAMAARNKKDIAEKLLEEVKKSDWTSPSEFPSNLAIPEKIQQEFLVLEKKYDSVLWQKVYSSLLALCNDENTVWLRFHAHNWVLRILAISPGENTEKDAIFHFESAQNLIPNHYFTFICMGNFYLQQKNIKEALFYWHKAKILFPPSSKWLLEYEDILCGKLLLNTTK